MKTFFFSFFRESRVSSNFFLYIFFFLAVGDWTFFYLENKAENVVCKVITFVRSFLLLLNIPRRHFYL